MQTALVRALIGAVLLLCGSAHAADFAVEDDSLVRVPAQVAQSIARAQQEPIIGFDKKPCRFVGKAFDLQDSGSAADWVVTTTDACSWAASAAPVWVLRKTSGGYNMVLSFVTYDLTIGKASQNGMRNLATARGTAARTEYQLWKFDGTEYRLARLRVTGG